MTTEATTAPATAAAPAAAQAAAPAVAPAADTRAPAPLTLETGAPAAASASAAPAAAAAPAGDKVVPVAYNPTGDDGLDMALKFVGDLGYAPDHPAMKAAMQGDFTMLEAELATKGVKGADAYMKLGQQAFARTRAKTEERQKADRAKVEGAVGGADAWRDIQKWASENADDTERAEISKALGAGGLQAQMAASWLKTAYDKANNVSTEGPGKQVAPTGGAATGGANAPLSAREYATAVAAARREHRGGSFEDSRAYKVLQARRMAYRG